nr:MAG TPA: hypothetical protein [Caudoviricetes sp.]
MKFDLRKVKRIFDITFITVCIIYLFYLIK